MRDNMFLKLDGVLGGSENPRHRGEIEISSFSWGGVTQGGTVTSGGGGGAGKVQFTSMTFTARADKASPFLMVYSAAGQHIKQAVLTIEGMSRTGNMIRSNTITMNDVLIGSAKSNGGTAEDGPNGVVTFVLDFVNYELGRG
jgi:type VI secretion system secreted protein Hcp